MVESKEEISDEQITNPYTLNSWHGFAVLHALTKNSLPLAKTSFSFFRVYLRESHFIHKVNPMNVKNYDIMSAFALQDDILFQTMIVHECLEFAAKLQLPDSIE